MFKLKTIISVALLTFLVSGNSSASQKNYGTATIHSIQSIYDADTFRVNIKGWPAIVGKNIPIRVNGIDAPEIKGKCVKEKNQARLAKMFTIKALRSAKTIELRKMRRGKYFRILADVYVDGKNLSSLLINTGLVRPYHGGKRDGWCHQ